MDIKWHFNIYEHDYIYAQLSLVEYSLRSELKKRCIFLVLLAFLSTFDKPLLT